MREFIEKVLDIVAPLAFLGMLFLIWSPEG